MGALLDITVQAVNKGNKLVTVAAVAGDGPPTHTTDWDGLSLGTLQPGAVVPCKYDPCTVMMSIPLCFVITAYFPC